MRTGGVGDAIAKALRDADVWTPLRDLGVPLGWHPHGTRGEILAELGLTAQDVARQITEWVSRTEPALRAPVVPAAGTRSRTTRK